MHATERRAKLSESLKRLHQAMVSPTLGPQSREEREIRKRGPAEIEAWIRRLEFGSSNFAWYCDSLKRRLSNELEWYDKVFDDDLLTPSLSRAIQSLWNTCDSIARASKKS